MEKEKVNKKDSEIADKFDILVSLLTEMRATRGDVSGRSVSVAITNLETARLWYYDALKDVEDAEASAR